MLLCDPKIGPLPVPYDFDYSGIVNAEYASPHPSLPIDEVTDRLFQWRGSLDEDFRNTYANFNQKKEAFFDLCRSFPHLKDGDKTEMITYLEEFYDQISSPEIMKAEMARARKKS